MGFQEYLTGMGLTVLFAIMLFGFIGTFIGTTNPDSVVLSKLNIENKSSELNNLLNDFSSTAESVKLASIGSEVSALEYVFLIFKEAFEIPKIIIPFFFKSIGTISTLLFDSFGGGLFGILLTSITLFIVAYLTFIGVFKLIEIVRTGQSKR